MTKRGYSIALFHTEFAYSGGAEKLVFKEVDYLSKYGHKVDIYTAYINRKGSFPKEIGKYKIKQIFPSIINILPHDLVILITTILFPLSLFKYRKYDIFIGHNQVGPWWAGMSAWFWKKQYLTYQSYPTTITNPRKIDKGAQRNSLVTHYILKLGRRIIVNLDKFFIKKAYACFCNGEYAQFVLEKTYGRRFINCPSGAEKQIFNKLIWKQRLNDPYILMTNRHFPAKHFEYGIKAIRDLGVKMIITGEETHYTKKLKSLITKYHIENKIVWAGMVDENKLHDLYKRAFVYAYTAPEEDFGMGIVEALSHGVPVVAWDQAGPKYIVNHGTSGYLADLNKKSTFTKYLGRLMEDTKLNYVLSENAYKESSKYSWDLHARIIDDKIKSIK